MSKRALKKDVAAAIDGAYDTAIADFKAHLKRCRRCSNGARCRKGQGILDDGDAEAIRRLGPIVMRTRGIA